jgi:hypothetical protein
MSAIQDLIPEVIHSQSEMLHEHIFDSQWLWKYKYLKFKFMSLSKKKFNDAVPLFCSVSVHTHFHRNLGE